MGWLFALLVAIGGAGALAWQYRRSSRNWAQLQEMVGDLMAGRALRSFDSGRGERRFVALTGQLQNVAEEQGRLRREEANLQAILASMGEGVLVVDKTHIIRLVNPSLHRILGLTTDPVGQPVLHGLRESQFEEAVRAVLENGLPQQVEVILEAVQPLRHVAIAATSMRDASGFPSVLMIVHDVTRLKKLEDVRREFVANVSHELRTPLAIFQGYLENLLENPDLPTESLVEVLNILQRHSIRLNLLVEDLLILARLESRSLELKLEPIPAGDFLRQMANDWKLRVEAKQITLSVKAPIGNEVFLADRFRMEQVLNNLLDNALKYSRQGGHVVLSSKVYGKEIEISVEDNGVGISPGDLPQVFERFFRVDKARSREQGGTGLGLSIVKHIAQLHGGSVEAQSDLEKGTRIILRLPRRPVASSADRSSKVEQSVAP